MGSELAIAAWFKPAITVGCLALLWSWESLHPFLTGRQGRLRHAGHNLALAAFNAVALALMFGVATVAVAGWANQNGYGLLHLGSMPWLLELFLALLLLDGWLYVWHWLNHRVGFLWRFHRMHHSDREMDVTTATRFHIGEHAGGAVLRLGLIPLFGVQAWHVVIYETLVVGITMFHHANISIGRADAWLRWLIVTPFMHKVHHSRWRPETDSNYSTLFSFWDRLAGTLRMRADCGTLELGLDEFDDPRWQTFGGMLKTPFIGSARVQAEATPPANVESVEGSRAHSGYAKVG